MRFRMPVDGGNAGEVWGLKLLLIVLPVFIVLAAFRQAPWWVYVMLVGMWFFSVGMLYLDRVIQDRARRKGRGIW